MRNAERLPNSCLLKPATSSMAPDSRRRTQLERLRTRGAFNGRFRREAVELIAFCNDGSPCGKRSSAEPAPVAPDRSTFLDSVPARSAAQQSRGKRPTGAGSGSFAIGVCHARITHQKLLIRDETTDDTRAGDQGSNNEGKAPLFRSRLRMHATSFLSTGSGETSQNRCAVSFIDLVSYPIQELGSEPLRAPATEALGSSCGASYSHVAVSSAGRSASRCPRTASRACRGRGTSTP